METLTFMSTRMASTYSFKTMQAVLTNQVAALTSFLLYYISPGVGSTNGGLNDTDRIDYLSSYIGSTLGLL